MLKESVINQIKELIISAGDMAARHHGGKLDIEIKSDDSPVTNVDKLLSAYIIQHLSALVPNVPIISEEEEIIDHGSVFFLIDPIDGTKSYIKGEDDYTVNIGLVENGVPTYGFIYQPAKKLLHYTDHNKKLVVEMEGMTIQKEAHHNDVYNQCIITISHRSSGSRLTQDFIKDHHATAVVQISSSIKLCMIADGSAHLYPRFGATMEWDIAAGHALILASGGDVLGMDGIRVKYGKPGLYNHDFVACGKGYTIPQS